MGQPYKKLRIFLNFTILGFILTGTSPLFQVRGQQRQTIDEVHIEELQRDMAMTANYGERLTHLEDTVAGIKSSVDESKWWERWIGLALIGAVLERILRASGLRGRSTDGEGPVG